MAYWDRISATKPAPEVLEKVIPLLGDQMGNPQSPHRDGTRAAGLLETAREQVAALISAEVQEMYFMSNGTESVNTAVQGLARGVHRKDSGRRKILISAVEHLSVKKSADYLMHEGFEVITIPVDSQGRLDVATYRDALDESVALVSIQMVNPEVGTVQDLETVVPLARESGALFHTDAVAAAGWIPVDVSVLGVDALSFSSAMYHGIPGAAALYLRRRVPFVPVLYGGVQERSRRPGAENIPAIVAMGIASEIAVSECADRMRHGNDLAAHLRNGLSGIPAVDFTGDWERRLPGHVSMLVNYVEGEALLLMLAMKGVSAASGSSCTAKDLKISPVLTSMGIDHTSAQGSLVLTSSRDTTIEDADAVIDVLPGIVDQLRAMSPIWPGKSID
jgi:cysteine desulfurase